MNDLIKKKPNNFESAKQNLDNIDQINSLKNDPFIKAAITTLLPGIGGLITDAFDIHFSEFQAQKRNQFLELIMSDTNITSDMVNDVEFIINFAKILGAINKLENNDKIKYFASLLKNSYFTDNKKDSNEFSEFFECLNSLSFKQIKILCILYSIESNPEPYIDKTISEKEHHISRYWGSFKHELKDKLSIEDEDVFPLMKSLERTGLFTIHNGFSFGSPEFGKLTPYFNKFAKIVEAI
jgi:hypothetical protein